jgi:hypothetical protein
MEWWNCSFGIWKYLFAKCIINHGRGSSIVGLASDENLKHDDFKDYIAPVAKMLKPGNLKYNRKCKEYIARLGCPV